MRTRTYVFYTYARLRAEHSAQYSKFYISTEPTVSRSRARARALYYCTRTMGDSLYAYNNNNNRHGGGGAPSDVGAVEKKWGKFTVFEKNGKNGKNSRW